SVTASVGVVVARGERRAANVRTAHARRRPRDVRDKALGQARVPHRVTGGWAASRTPIPRLADTAPRGAPPPRRRGRRSAGSAHPPCPVPDEREGILTWCCAPGRGI